MPIYERISAVVCLTMMGLALYFVLPFAPEPATLTLFASPLTLTSPQQGLMAVLLAALAMVGVDMVLRAQPHLPDRRLSYLAPAGMLPALLVILATQTLDMAPTPLAWGIGLAAVGLLLWLTIIAEYRQVSFDAPPRWTYLWQQFMGYGLALAFFIIIYQTRSRSAFSATAILLVSGMIALALLRQPSAAAAKTWLLAGVISLIMGQITWALNYWRGSNMHVSLLLLLIFYILTGLAHQQLMGKLSRRAAWEFGAIAAAVWVVIFSM